MKWTEVQDERASVFRRLIGVTKPQFEDMAAYLEEQRQLSNHRHTGAKRGPKPRLSVEDELLMMLMYYREYRTFLHIGKTYGVSEKQAWRIIIRTERLLIGSRLFALPGKKKLLDEENHFEVVLVDVSEHPIERPKKSSDDTTRAKRRSTP